MSYYALWIDHKHAFVYKFTASGVEEQKYENQGHEPHKDDKHKGHNAFYHTVAEKIKDAKELMVMGPGVAKDEFKHHCENHHHAALANSIVGMETMVSHPSRNMMLEKASTFFKSYHTWTKNY